MIVGILSDTHDAIHETERAVNVFKKLGVGAILHAGDYCTIKALKPLQQLGVPLYGVLGENDIAREALMLRSNYAIQPGPYQFELGGRIVLLVHDQHKLDLAKARLQPHLVVSGHTHSAFVERREGILYVNPGEASGLITGTPTVAWVNLTTLEAHIVTLLEGEAQC